MCCMKFHVPNFEHSVWYIDVQYSFVHLFKKHLFIYDIYIYVFPKHWVMQGTKQPYLHSSLGER